MEAYKLNGVVVPGMLQDTGEENAEATDDPVTSAPAETSGDIAADPDNEDKVPADATAAFVQENKDQTASDNTPAPSASAKDHRSRKQL